MKDLAVSLLILLLNRHVMFPASLSGIKNMSDCPYRYGIFWDPFLLVLPLYTFLIPLRQLFFTGKLFDEMTAVSIPEPPQGIRLPQISPFLYHPLTPC